MFISETVRRALEDERRWEDIEAGLGALARLAYEVPPRILITGSLYFAGHVLKINGTPPA